VEGSVQYLIDGKQDMTVYCNPAMIAVAAMELAQKMIAGEAVSTSETINNEKIDIPVVRCDVQPITRDNLVEVWLDTGVYNKADYTNFEGISDAVKPANYNN
jgi:putative multiple sugar transport system substrate-binding protein